jgi:small multidrug resistance pump
MTWVLLGLAIASEVAGTLSLRASDGFSRVPWAAATLAGYVIAFALLAQVLKLGMPVGVAYGIWAAIGVALTAFAGRILWGDPLTPMMGVGITLIVGGVLLVELGSNAAS